MSRKLARVAAFKALFSLDFNPLDSDIAINNVCLDNPRLSKNDLQYIHDTVSGTLSNLDSIDTIIINHLKPGWLLHRLMSTDKIILRLAIYELLFANPHIPKNIVINEAVELAKLFGSDDSPKFINGILEVISHV